MCAWWCHVETLAQGKEELRHVAMPLCKFYAKVVTVYMTTAIGVMLANFPNLEMPLTDKIISPIRAENTYSRLGRDLHTTQAFLAGNTHFR